VAGAKARGTTARAALVGVGADPLGELLGDLQVLRREGDLPPEIAIILGLSARTVEAYIERACEKLGVRTRIQAVVRARRDGLLEEVSI
jgi:hypothetical protein